MAIRMDKKSIASTVGPVIVILGLMVVIIAGISGILSNCPSIYLSCAHSPLIKILEAGLILILFGTLGLVYYKHLPYVGKRKGNRP
jgi:hypothetical protein